MVDVPLISQVPPATVPTYSVFGQLPVPQQFPGATDNR